MKTEKYIRPGLLVTISQSLLITLACASISVAQDWNAVEIKATHVRGAIYMLEGSGGNIGVSVGDDGILMVDDQFAPLAEKIEKALTDLGGGKLRFLLNTHWHGDHTGGNEFFGAKTTIIAHENVRTRLTTAQTQRGRNIPAQSKDGWPVITLDKSLSIHFNGEKIEVIHYPHGHTDGDIVIFFSESHVAHLGDDFFSGRFPFIDLDHGGSVESLIESVGLIIDRLPEDVRIIPGHGPLSDLDDLKAYHEMLRKTSALVNQEMKNGKTLKEITEKGLPAEWSDWSWNFISTDRWIETIYTSYSQ